jgi:hypothetical protein
MDIGFVDRYGGNTPSWLRGCHGDCEAMGYYPVKFKEIQPGLTAYEVEQVKLQIERQGKTSDGWCFIKCPDCHGTGRVSWLVTIARIPQWFCKGVKFCFTSHANREDWSWWRNFKVRFVCAFVLDIKRLKN